MVLRQPSDGAANDGAAGVVVIGRNEGERLERCLDSVLVQARHVVYVDSGSTDDSVAVARRRGALVVELDPKLPFTAARARNEGVRRLQEAGPSLEFVQFVDGDCELHPEWLARALDEARAFPRAAVVCGRRRERRPEESVYNHLCDLEWATPVGDALACGGDALMRLQAFDEAGGFAPDLIAGEEPDLCYRMRKNGWTVRRVDAEMTLHDAAMTRLSQWWRRNVRSGHATAEAFVRRTGDEARLALKQLVSNAVWALPLSWPLWPMLWYRVYQRQPDPAYATFIVLGKLPHAQGQLGFFYDRLTNEKTKLIEYK